MVGVHVVATAPHAGAMPSPVELGSGDAAAAIRSTRSIDFADDGIHSSPVYDAEGLTPGMSFAGPVAVEGAGTSVLVHPGWGATIDGHGKLLLEQAPATDSTQDEE